MPSQTLSPDLPEAVPDALVGVDNSGIIRFVNCQTTSLFGYEPEDLVGAPLEALVPKSLRQVRAAHGQEYDPGARTRHTGTGLRRSGLRRDGTKFPVNITYSPMDTENGLLVIAAVRDMTRFQPAEKHRRRLERLSAVVESSAVAITSSSLDGRITSWNPAAERLYGYSAQEIVGQSDELLSPAKRTGENRALLGRIELGEQVDNYETVRLQKDGTAFEVSLSLAPIWEPGGTIIGASVVAREVTMQKKASDLARSMIESSLDSLVAISPQGWITDVNEATTRVTGVPREKLIGTSFSEYFTDPEQAEQIYQKVFTEGMAVDYPLTLRRRDGHLTNTEVLYNASVYRDPLGKVIGVFAAARDVTKQVKGQREIATQQAKELDRLAELEQFKRLTVGRELKMIELKKEIESLKEGGATRTSRSSPRGGADDQH